MRKMPPAPFGCIAGDLVASFEHKGLEMTVLTRNLGVAIDSAFLYPDNERESSVRCRTDPLFCPTRGGR